MKTPVLSTLHHLFRMAHHAQSQERDLADFIEEKVFYAASRRKFLQTTVQAGAVFGFTGFRSVEAMVRPLAAENTRIAIIGAGIGGLNTAWQLRKKGIFATIFEADKRAGGRIKTGRNFGNGSLTSEYGAEFIDTGHADMLKLVGELGLNEALLDVSTDHFGVKETFFIHQKQYTVQDIVSQLKVAYPEIIRHRNHSGRKAKWFDRMSLASYIEQMPVDKWLKRLLHITYTAENGLDTAEQSALNMIGALDINEGAFLPYGASDERFKLRGGNDQIPQRLAMEMADQIRYQQQLIAIREHANLSMTLTFSDQGTTREETFDLVVLALPFTILRTLDIQMDLPKIKKKVIHDLGYGTNSKLIFETHSRPWRAAGSQGYLFNDAIQNGWDSTHLQRENTGQGTFTCFAGGAQGQFMSQTQEQQDQMSQPIDQAFPGFVAARTGKTELANWSNQPLVLSSYSCLKPGQTTQFAGAAFAPVRGLYFAGEHCSTDHWGFMNGAAETGRRVAEMIGVRMKK